MEEAQAVADATLAGEVADLAESGLVDHDQNGIIRYSNSYDDRMHLNTRTARSGEGERVTACLGGMVFLLRGPEETDVISGGIWFHDASKDDYWVDLLDWAEEQLHAAPGVTGEIFYEPDAATAIARMRYLAGHPDATASDVKAVTPAAA